MGRPRARSVAWVAGVALAALAVTAMVREVARRGRFAVPRSSYSTAADGTKALALLARAGGRTVRALRRDLGHLPRGRGVLVACGDAWDDPPRPLSRTEQKALAKWIEGGGALVVLGARGYLPEPLGLLVFPPELPDKDLPSRAERRRQKTMPWDDPVFAARVALRRRTVAATLRPHALTQGLHRLTLVAPGHLKVTDGDWETIAAGPKEELIVVRTLGRGRIAVSASASFVTNDGLARDDHAELALRLLALGRGPVLFDELHLGMASSESLTGYLRDKGLLPAVLQALLAVMLLVWRAGARFGRPRPAPPPEIPDVTTYVDAAGRIYARAADVPASMRRLAAHALARVAARHGVRGGASLHPTGCESAAAIALQLRERGRVQAAAAVEAVARRLDGAVSAAPKGGAAERALVQFARALDDDVAPALSTDGQRPPPSDPPEASA